MDRLIAFVGFMTLALVSSSPLSATEAGYLQDKIERENPMVWLLNAGSIEFDCQSFLANEIKGRESGAAISQTEQALCKKQIDYLFESRKTFVLTASSVVLGTTAVTLGLYYGQALRDLRFYKAQS